MHVIDFSKLAWSENGKEVTLRPYSVNYGKTDKLVLSLHSKTSTPRVLLLHNRKVTLRGPFIPLGASSSIYLELKAIGQAGNIFFFLLNSRINEFLVFFLLN